ASRFPGRASEIDADGDVAALELGNLHSVSLHLRELRVVCHGFLHFAVDFPIGVARRHQQLSSPRTGVEAGESKKFGAMLLKDLLRLSDDLDQFLWLVGLEAGELNDRHGLPPSLCKLSKRHVSSDV